jgi:hypothetical protein
VVGGGLHRGEEKGKDWVEKTLGWSVDVVEGAKKPAPEEVLRRAWAREWAKEVMKLDWENLMLPKGFQVVPRVGGLWSGHFLGSSSKGG